MCRNTGSVPLWFLGVLTSDFASSPWSVRPSLLMFPQLQLTLSFSSLSAAGDVTLPSSSLPPVQCHGHLPAYLLQHQHVPGNEHGQQHCQPAAQSQGVQPEPGAHSQLRRGEAGGGRGHPLPLYPAGRHCLWDEHHPTYVGSLRLLFVLEPPWVYFT